MCFLPLAKVQIRGSDLRYFWKPKAFALKLVHEPESSVGYKNQVCRVEPETSPDIVRFAYFRNEFPLMRCQEYGSLRSTRALGEMESQALFRTEFNRKNVVSK